ncbi:diaminopimelate decarboxylase [Castellaniella sp.]|uniref:diaminopimelate decarboxylase n=1 Tax=Castellaniella sp. TaxID=1955812 RepID=UPI002AFF9EBC|nr:diaminopimelate decarboxylase [Castellaniella sp.]
MNTALHFPTRHGVLHAEDIPLSDLAQQHGTPLYVYSRAALQAAWQRYESAIAGRNALVCYGVKANSNLAVLHEFQRLGAGFDIVSGGELARVMAAGASASRIVFSGVGKQAWEIRQALTAGIKCFNVESADELTRLAAIAQEMGVRAPVSLRVNPDVDAKTHPYISTGLKDNKFGIDIRQAPALYRQAQQHPSLEIMGVDCHIGSQITEISPYLDALDKLLTLIDLLKADGITLRHLDLGGGLGIRYIDENPPHPADLLNPVFAALQQHGLDNLQLILEPGRSLVGNAGVLLTRVEYLKHTEARNFAIVDAAMNDLMRPALYEAWHDVTPVQPHADASTHTYDIVGPICESGDWLARGRSLALAQGDLLAIQSAGAYAFSMSSQYNSRPRAAEVLVDGSQSWLVRPRETIQDLYAQERIIPGPD